MVLWIDLTEHVLISCTVVYIYFPLTQSDPGNVAIISGLSECPLGMATVWRNRALNVGFVQRVHPKRSRFMLRARNPHAGVPLTSTVLVASTNLWQTNKKTRKAYV